MSGGTFNYDQFRINDIIDNIKRYIEGKHQEYWMEEQYHDEVIKRFEEAILTLELAETMATRIDWLIAGDDSCESFIKRWDKQVSEIKGKE